MALSKIFTSVIITGLCLNWNKKKKTGVTTAGDTKENEIVVPLNI